MRDRDNFYFRQEYERDRDPRGESRRLYSRSRQRPGHARDAYAWERWYEDPGRYDQDPGQEDFDSQGHGLDEGNQKPSITGAGYRFNDQGTNRPELWEQRGAYTGRGPRNYTISDSEILEDVNEHLMRSGDIDARNVEVQVNGGEVTLTGRVNSRLEKRIAEEVADWVPGVQEVTNKLKVTPF
jgi:hypothetical protein